MVLDNNNGLVNGLNLYSTFIHSALPFVFYSPIHIFVSLKVSFYEVKCISLCTAALCPVSLFLCFLFCHGLVFSFLCMPLPLSLIGISIVIFPQIPFLTLDFFDKLKASPQCIVNRDRTDGRVTKILTQI